MDGQGGRRPGASSHSEASLDRDGSGDEDRLPWDDEDEEDDDEDDDEDDEDEEQRAALESASQRQVRSSPSPGGDDAPGRAAETPDGRAAEAADGEVGDDERVFSVYIFLPEGFEGIPIDMIFDDTVQARIFDTCRRALNLEVFRRLWPRGRRELLESLRRGVEEHGRGPVAHGLNRSQAQGLVRRLMDFVSAEMGVDREAAARYNRVEGQDPAPSAAAGDDAGDARAGDAPAGARGGGRGGAGADQDDQRIHSVFLVLESDMQGMLDLLLPEIAEVCRRHREFAASWPGGPSEMERALRQGLEEFSEGPLLHGLSLSQAEGLRAHLGEFVRVKVTEDREAAARIRERERRNRPPTQPPSASLVGKFPPGARVRVVADSPEVLERAQKGYGGLPERAADCLGQPGAIVGYAPADGAGVWAVMVSCDLESGALVGEWNPSVLRVTPEEEAASEAQGDGEDVSPASSVAAIAALAGIAAPPSGRSRQPEVLCVGDEDLLVGDEVLFNRDGRWHVGRVVAAGDGDADSTFDIEGVDGQTEQRVGKKQVQMIVRIEALPKPLSEGTVVRITGDVDKAKSLLRSRWKDELLPCLGELGVVEEAKDRRRITVVCPAAAAPMSLDARCLELDESDGLWCLDIHEHALWWCSKLATPRSCVAQCGAQDLKEAYCCLRTGSCNDCVLCTACAGPYLERKSSGKLRSRHHLCPLSIVALPRGPRESRWSCSGELASGGCRSEPTFCGDAGDESLKQQAAFCPECEFMICSACLADEELGESAEKTRLADATGDAESLARVQATLRAHPSEIFALSEAGLFANLAQLLASGGKGSGPSQPAGAASSAASPASADSGTGTVAAPDAAVAAASVANAAAAVGAARALALELGAWLAGSAPERVHAGPLLADAGDGTWAEGFALAETTCSFDGTWTDEAEPGRWIRRIVGSTLYPPEAGQELSMDHAIEVSGCGVEEFDGKYVADGIKNGKTKYCKAGSGPAGNGPQTLNFSSGSWYLSRNYAGSWYQALGDGDAPPSSGWTVGSLGIAPAPRSVERVGTGPAPPASATAPPPPSNGFGQLPSVGTWLALAPRRHEAPARIAEVAVAPPRSQRTPSLDGAWRREAPGGPIVIDGRRLTWADGTTTTLTILGVGEVSMTYQGQVFTGVAEEGGQRLVWSDGDVWIREPDLLIGSFRRPLPGELLDAAPLQEGLSVTYRGIPGCTVKRVLGPDKVLIHIPSVGDEEAKMGADGSEEPARIERLSRDAFFVELGNTLRCAQLTADGRLAWADGGSTWIRLEHCPRCRAGHVLRRSRHTAPWTCGECEERRSERQRLRCGACNYNLCRSCLAVRSWEGSVPANCSEAPFPPGDDAEVRLVTSGTRHNEWVKCSVSGYDEQKATYSVVVPQSGAEASQAGKEIQGVPSVRLRRGDLVPAHGAVDALWRYASPNDIAIGIRTVPEIEGPRDGQLEHGQVFRVSEHREGVRGILFLRLADGRGWVFDKKPGVGTMCILLRQRQLQPGDARLGEAEAAGGRCAVAWADAGSGSPAAWLPMKSLRPIDNTIAPRDRGGDFLRAELLRELRRGPRCAAHRVQGILDGRANLLSVAGGPDPMALAIKMRCKAPVLEALLIAGAPLGPLPPPVPPCAAEDEEDLAVGAAASDGEAEDPVQALVATDEPRLAALMAERGGALAEAAAVAMEALAARLEKGLAERTEAAQGGESTPVAVDEDEQLMHTARGCAAAARRLAQCPRPRGDFTELLCRFGRELLTPLLQASDEGGGLLEPGGRLGGLLGALGAAGYVPTTAQADCLAAAIASRLAEEPDGGSGRGLLGLLGLLLVAFRPRGNIPACSTLRVALYRHGVAACIERLADSGTAVWARRGMDSGALRATAASLLRRLQSTEEGEAAEMSAEDEAAAPVSRDALARSLALVQSSSQDAQDLIRKLPTREALERVIEMLRDGQCTAFELGVLGAPTQMLPAFEEPGGAWPWPGSAPTDLESMGLLVGKLQALLGLCENYPVAALMVRGEGLNCILQPHILALEGRGGCRELKVEPLLALSDLERFVLHTTTVDDAGYLAWCERLAGRRIAERSSFGAAGAAAPWRAARVIRLSLRHKFPVHHVRYESDGSEAHLVLHLRAVVVLKDEEGSQPCDDDARQDSEDAEKAAALGVGARVQARFLDGSWCRATIEKDNGDGMYTIRWENGTVTDTVKGPVDLRPLPGKHVCQRVQITQEGSAAAGVAVWEHASGAQDVIDQDGRFFAFVPRGSVVPEARHARESPGRPMPFEIRNLAMTPERSAPPSVVSLERSFSAVDRNYRPRDFQYKNPARKIGGPEGEPLERPRVPEIAEGEALRPTVEQEVQAGTPAPRLGVRFFAIGLEEADAPRKAAEGSQSSSPVCGEAQRSDPPSPQHPPSPPPPSGAPSGAASVAPSRASSGAASPGSRAAAEELASRSKALAPLPASSTVLQALLRFEPGGRAELPERLRLKYEVYVAPEGGASADAPAPEKQQASQVMAADADAASGSASIPSAPVLAMLKQLRRYWREARASGAASTPTEVRWESARLNRKLKDLLAQPLLTAAVAAPSWVLTLPLSYPFLFQRSVREQLLRCTAFGTSHAILWLQRQWIEERYGSQLRRVEGQLEGRMDLTEHIVSDPRVFIGPARSDFVTLPSRDDLLANAERVVELTHASKAMLEVKFADEGGFGDGVTQSFYTAVSAELSVADVGGSRPLCGLTGLWAEHLPESVVEHRGRKFLHSRRGLFPRPCFPGSPESDALCGRFRFLGRLMAKALRDGFVVPLPLCERFFQAVLGEDLPLAALPSPGDGLAGEFMGAAARYAADLRREIAAQSPPLQGDALANFRADAAERPGWGKDYLGIKSGDAMDWSFHAYATTCGITFCETGLSGPELCEGGSNRYVEASNLEEFVESAAYWWLREGIAPQVAAFRQGVEDVCASAAIWAFEASELSALFCGGHVEFSKEQLQRHLRPKGGIEIQDLDLLVEVLARLTPDRCGQFLEFVTACPRLPPGGLSAAEISVSPAQPAGSLPRARTCTKELRLPKYTSAAQLEERLLWALDNAEGLYDDDRMV